MQIKFVKQNISDYLTLFFLGFGQDAIPFKNLNPGTDLVLVYDYGDDKADFSFLKQYKHIKVVAWSLGVMMANYLVASLPIKADKLIAFNGTPCGIDDTKGVRSDLYNATLINLSEDNMLKFYRRMCGRGPLFNEFLNEKPDRSLESLKHELTFLKDKASNLVVPEIIWDVAYIGIKDAIVSAQNQEEGWQGNARLITHIDAAHYDKSFFKRIIEE